MATPEFLMRTLFGRVCPDPVRRVGAEVETSFVTALGFPATIEAVQLGFRQLITVGWKALDAKGPIVTELVKDGWRISFELGRQNVELASPPMDRSDLIAAVQATLVELYQAMAGAGLQPVFQPVLETDEDLLIIPDERDATWLKLDGRNSLNLLARSSSVQFTFALSPSEAISVINRLNANRDRFLSDYPQEVMWRRYIAESHAGYDPQRYGGPAHFCSLEHYCCELAKQPVVMGEQLVPFAEVDGEQLDVSLFVRSVWWYFRLKRFDDTLCVEVRSLPRREDDRLAEQFMLVEDIIGRS